MMSYRTLFVVTALVSECVLAGRTTVTDIPAKPGTGAATGLFTSTAHTLDAPKVSDFNTTAWDWWYFDAFSRSTNASAVVVFFASTPAGFVFNARSTNLTNAMIWLTLANGTRLPTLTFDANGAQVTTKSGVDGSSGVWVGSGFEFKSRSNGRRYIITVNVPSVDLKGEMKLRYVTPAHYPNSLDRAGASMELVPTIGWSNAMPDAHATVSFGIGDEEVRFTDGVGYHDKNWGIAPFVQKVQTWVWGHGRLGEYSLVWFDTMDWAGVEYVSAYVSKNGKVVSASTKTNSVRVRPTGPGDATTYPPTATSTWPTGFTAVFKLPEGDLAVTLTNEVFLVEYASYLRWKGALTGQLNGRTLTGHGLWEQFNIRVLLG